MTAKVPAWPPTASRLLAEFKAAMTRRSKGLRNQLRTWECERFTEERDDCSVESLLVSFDAYGTEFALRLWEDGVLWFSVRKLEARRKVFELSFDGRLGDLSCAALLETIEASFASEPSRAELLRLWSPFDPSCS